MQAIDAVITWVDGGDPAHRRKFLAHVPAPERARHAAADATRFGDCGEVGWCVASLLRFAPWLRTIFIVADAQEPGMMARIRGTPLAARVRMVDHREIFAGYERFLPTFSNRSIEAMLHRIPGLADRFLYLNDDFMLLQPVAPDDFFRGDGVVLRGRWRGGTAQARWQQARAALSALLRAGREPARVARPGQHEAQRMSAVLAGFRGRYFQFPHCPAPLRRDTIAHWFQAHPDVLERNLGYRLRSAGQFLTVALANHLELAAGTAVVDNRLAPMRLKPASHALASIRAETALADREPRYAFACVQSLDEADAPIRDFIVNWLDARIGPPP